MSSPFPPALSRLIKNLSMLPGVGDKTATRLAMTILRWKESQARELAASIGELHGRIKLCSTCFTFSEEDPCPLCRDPRRERDTLCVVEDPADLLVIEKAGGYRGLYHVLHGLLSPMDGIGPEQLRIEELMTRLARERVKEVILATSSTASGEATASYLADRLAGVGVSVSRIACGIPMGMDIKYADGQTLQRAMESRKGL